MSVTVVVCTMVPLVPVILIVRLPIVAVLATVKVRVVDPDDVTEGGLNFPVIFEGNPVTLKVVTPTNPPEGVSVTTTWPLVPRVIVMAVGDADMEKLPGEFTRSCRGAVRVKAPLSPVTVIV